jgi:plasmid maintenance system antidote protein VapI
MTPKQFTKCLEQIDWTMRGVADHLGVHETRVRRWATGALPVPDKVAQWLETLASTHAKNPPPELEQ